MTAERLDSSGGSVPDVAVVILTRGDRPAELAEAVGSVRAQCDVSAEIVIVANGVPREAVAVESAADLTVLSTEENLGIPGGRNAGAAVVRAPLVAFLDDDARFVDPTTLARAVAAFSSDASLGAIALHIVDDRGATSRRHVPRIGARRPDRSGQVTAFLGGAVVLRADAFERCGGYAGEFFYAMEETDLALRLADRGWRIHYDGVRSVHHPATEPDRHSGALRHTMRNRVWLAHRNLPALIAVLYVANWFTISAIRRPRSVPALAASVVAAWRSRPGPRRPIRWSTVVTLTRLGRPPIV